MIFDQCCHFQQMVFLASLRENYKWIKDKVRYALMKEPVADFCQVWNFPNWNFPNCLDGKHIDKSTSRLASMYFNCKQFFSIVLTALVDAQFKFLFIDVGSCGRFADGRILTVVTCHPHWRWSTTSGPLRLRTSCMVANLEYYWSVCE